MPQYKFVTVPGGVEKPSKLPGSIRSHAIRSGLQRTTTHSRAKVTAQARGSAKFEGELMFCAELRGGTGILMGQAMPSVMLAESTTAEYRTANIQSAPKTSAEVGLCLKPHPRDAPAGLMILQHQSSTQRRIYRIESVCGSVDPFNTFPIPTNLEVDYLVKYFMTKFDLNMAAVDRGKSWFTYALESAPMMHSTLAMAAAMWRAEYPALERSTQLEGIRQKGEAIREIRAWLAQANSVRESNEITFLMTSMSNLAIVEVWDNDFEAAKTHLRGVHNLFSLRGGRDSFKDEFILCKSINVADIQVAAVLGRQLIFPLLHTDQDYLPASIFEYARYPPLDHSILDDDLHDHAEIFTQIRHLLLAHQLSIVSLEAQQIQLNVVDDLILRHLYQDFIDSSDASRRSRALVLAAHVFMYLTLRQVPPNSPQVRRICTRLQSAIGSTPTAGETWTKNRAALLWMAFVGLLGTGYKSETSPEGQWFLNLFHSTIQGYPQYFPLGNGGVRKILSTFLWDEDYCQPILASLEERVGG